MNWFFLSVKVIFLEERALAHALLFLFEGGATRLLLTFFSAHSGRSSLAMPRRLARQWRRLFVDTPRGHCPMDRPSVRAF